MWRILVTLLLASPGIASDISADEEVLFFPTVACFDEKENAWAVPIHGWIFEPERDSIRRAAALSLLRRTLGLGDLDSEAAIFEDRARLFLVDSERGQQTHIRIGDQTHVLPESEANGHMETTLRIPAESLQSRPADSPGDGRWLSLDAVMPKGDNRRFTGSAQLLRPTGLSVISDIDDTIKVSNVSHKQLLLINTFLRDFEAVPGMAGAYRAWAKAGASFHYISASPWQLYTPLSTFTDKEGFPKGTFHLKSFRVKDSSFLNLFESPYEYKLSVIEPVLKIFPRRRFVLVGDSSEKDPEVYGRLARSHPDQILRIFIRDVTDEPANCDRYRKAFEKVPADRWSIFRKAGELPVTIAQ